jgi:hypothetical protein
MTTNSSDLYRKKSGKTGNRNYALPSLSASPEYQNGCPRALVNPEKRSKRMKVGDHVYLVTDQLQTGGGIPAMIYALQDSTVEVVVESTHGPEILNVANREDIVPSNLYTHSILNSVYQSCREIEHEYGSILNLTSEEIVSKLTQRGLAPETARRCADMLDGVEWLKTQLPLRHWLESIRDFYHRPRLCTEVLALAPHSLAPAS